MTELRITTTATTRELAMAGSIITFRALGPWRRVALVLGVFAGAYGGGAAYASVVGLPFSAYMNVSLFSLVGAALGFGLVRFTHVRYLQRALAALNSQGKSRDMILDPSGMTLPQRHLPWSGFYGVQRWKTATLVMSSRADGFVIPDRDLPQGMSAAELASLIEGWKAKA